jgi:Kef-type K+ transport system membrane component KefB
MVLLFALAVLAVYMGVAAIVGAFLAGMALSESIGPQTKDLSQGVTELLAPFFLAGVGLRVDPGSFSGGMGLLLAAVLLVIAVVSKVAGCGLGALRLGRVDALRVGVGMIPRGEVGMAVAQLGLTAGIIAHGVYSSVVLVAVATTLLAPPLMKLAFRGAAHDAAGEETFHLG